MEGLKQNKMNQHREFWMKKRYIVNIDKQKQSTSQNQWLSLKNSKKMIMYLEVCNLKENIPSKIEDTGKNYNQGIHF